MMVIIFNEAVGVNFNTTREHLTEFSGLTTGARNDLEKVRNSVQNLHPVSRRVLSMRAKETHGISPLAIHKEWSLHLVYILDGNLDLITLVIGLTALFCVVLPRT
jgi:hypothetical protein